MNHDEIKHLVIAQLMADDKHVLLIGSGNNGKTHLIQEILNEYPGAADRIFEDNCMNDTDYNNVNVNVISMEHLSHGESSEFTDLDM